VQNDPVLVIPQPDKNLNVAPGLKKVVTTNPDSYNPDEAQQENHSLK
jgi:hypothetical protein